MPRIPQADTIHLVLDNLSTHTRKAVVGPLWEASWKLDMESLHAPLHAQTRKLVESSRDGNQPVQQAMLGPPQNRLHQRTPPTGPRLEPQSQS